MSHLRLGHPYASSRPMTLRILLLICGMLVPLSSDIAHGEDHALLIGVSNYPELADRYQLYGPGNDVKSMRELLIDKFSFPADRIVVLSEEQGRNDPLLLPTRANIEREFLRLGQAAASDSQVVIFMAGHGAQQPEQRAGSESDHLDEIFLTRDVKRWQQELATVPNAIIDDEIETWLNAIHSSGAHVWAIFDCCHAGDLSRGLRERERFVDPFDKDGLAIPATALRGDLPAAVNQPSRAEGKNRGPLDDKPPLNLPTMGNLAVFYACQSHEKALEIPFPSRPDEKYFGLLSYSIRAVLSKAKGPLSYRELNRQIYRQYVLAGRVDGPTPLAEGAGLDRSILGNEKIARSPIQVTFDPQDENQNRLRIDAGRLHGITAGSVLSVFSTLEEATNSAGKTPVGQLRVTAVDITSASVVPSGVPKKSAKALAGSYCAVVEIDYGELRLPVAVDRQDADGKPVSEAAILKLETQLRALAAEKGSLITIARDPNLARWLARVRGAGVVLTSSRVTQPSSTASDLTEQKVEFGPFSQDEKWRETVGVSLNRIARVENLMGLASSGDVNSGAAHDPERPRIKIEGFVLEGTTTRPMNQLPLVRPGNELDLQVTNVGGKDFDLTVLYVDSQMGIFALYPEQNHINRIRPRQMKKLPLAVFNAGPYGRGHFLFIALTAEAVQPVDLTWLAQPAIPKVRSSPSSPLEGLLENAVFAEGKTRSSNSRVAYSLDILPVDVNPAKQ